jgi:hypothetical protein
VPGRVPLAATAVTLAAVVVALASAAHSGRSVWRRLDAERTADARLSADERRRAPLERSGVPGGAFDFYAAYTAPGDRIFLQVPRRRQAAFAAAARFYLLPAVLTSSPADATVVLSYRANPAALHLSYVTQRRDGSSPIYVSRIGAP